MAVCCTASSGVGKEMGPVRLGFGAFTTTFLTDYAQPTTRSRSGALGERRQAVKRPRRGRAMSRFAADSDRPV